MDGRSAKERLLDAVGELDALGDIETIIRSKLHSDVSLLQEIPEYLLELGGKRIRPALCLLIWKSFSLSPPRPELLQVASGIELIHMATLLHDDIIDHSEVRRSQESPFKRYGLGNTLLSGDFLLVRAFSLCARLDSFIIDATEQACIELTEGEILETAYPLSEYSLEMSLEIARKKTASLFRLAAESAGNLLGFSEGTRQCIAQFGENLGIAFQVLDDLLDVVADEDLLGKRTGTDIRERKPSVINLLWLQSKDPLASTVLLSNESPTDKEIENAIQTLRKSVHVEGARKLAREFAHKARNALQVASGEQQPTDWNAFQSLEALIQYTIDRVG